MYVYAQIHLRVFICICAHLGNSYILLTLSKLLTNLLTSSLIVALFSPVTPKSSGSVPCRCVLGRDAPRQVVVAVVPAGVVKEVPSGGQDVVRYARDTLWTVSALELAPSS